MVASFVDRRLKGGFFGKRKLEGVSERTANLDVITLRNVLNAAIDDGLLRDLPRIKLLKEPPAPKRQLLTTEEFDSLIKSARTRCRNNGPQLADYLRFLAFSGVPGTGSLASPMDGFGFSTRADNSWRRPPFKKPREQDRRV